jgi:hypothetical protein
MSGDSFTNMKGRQRISRKAAKAPRIPLRLSGFARGILSSIRTPEIFQIILILSDFPDDC